MKGLKHRGRPPILLADSVKSVANLKHSLAETIMDRSQPMTADLVNEVIRQSVFGWEGRKPTPAYDDNGKFVGTDLDLLSFLVPVAERGAVIEIPHYENRRKTVVRESERKIGNSQFGQVVGLVSNREVFSFSVRIWDQSIAKVDPGTGRESMGAFRNYMIVDVDGHWYDGWSKIVWKPDAAENRFLKERGLWSRNTVLFNNWVHPNRWQSIFGAPYLLLKMLSERLSDEARFYRSEVKRLVEVGITPPVNESDYEPSVAVGESQKVEVGTMEAVLDIPDFTGSYQTVLKTTHCLATALERARELSYSLRPRAQFIIRADEAAYYRYGEGRVASWMEGRKWNKGYKPPRGRVEWDQMVLSNDMALRLRCKTVTQEVSAD